MSDEYLKILELTDKVKNIESTIELCSFRAKRNRKYISKCKNMCKYTNDLIGEINGKSENI